LLYCLPGANVPGKQYFFVVFVLFWYYCSCVNHEHLKKKSMKKHLLLAIVLLFTTCYSRAQGFSIQSSPPPKAEPVAVTGVLKDTANFMSAGYASVSLIRASDSILQTFTRTDQDGRFSLKAPGKGRYLIMISHPSFAILVD